MIIKNSKKVRIGEKKLNPIITLSQCEKHVDKRINAKNPVMKEEERVCQILSDLKKENKISNELYEELKPVGSQPPRLYGLAKVHKPEMPLRPIDFRTVAIISNGTSHWPQPL